MRIKDWENGETISSMKIQELNILLLQNSIQVIFDILKKINIIIVTLIFSLKKMF